ncbi:MAG: DNA-directed RNA polymerase subunit omega [Pseudomonadota bacterium]
MARVTIEDCLEHVDNRFDLVVTAARRARHIAMGGEALVEADGDKPTVTALREVADGLVTQDVLAMAIEHRPPPVAPIIRDEDARDF